MMRFQPTYVSRGVMRAYGIEHPIGDAFGGAAYGEKNSGGGLFGGIGSIIGGIAVIASGGTLAPLMGGLMIAGGAMSTIGSISGNSTLTKIGGITAAVGGIGSIGGALYDNWGSITDTVGGWLSNGTELSTQAAGDAGNLTNAVSSGTDMSQWANDPNYLEALNGSNNVSQSIMSTPTEAAFQGGGYNSDQLANAMADQISLTQQPVSQALSANLNPNNMVASTQGMTDAGGVMNSGGMGSSFNSSAKLADGVSQGSNYYALPGSPSVGAAGTTPFDATSSSFWNTSAAQGATVPGVGEVSNFVTRTPVADVVGGAGGGGGNTGLLSRIGNFIEKNPMASMMGMQAISGMAQGASPKSQAEGEYLQAMAQLKQAESDYIAAQQDYLSGAKSAETAANTEYLQAKAAEFDKTKQYAEEKRKAYNDSIKNLQQPTSYVDYSTSLFNPTTANTNAGIINGARA